MSRCTPRKLLSVAALSTGAALSFGCQHPEPRTVAPLEPRAVAAAQERTPEPVAVDGWHQSLPPAEGARAGEGGSGRVIDEAVLVPASVVVPSEAAPSEHTACPIGNSKAPRYDACTPAPEIPQA